MIHYADDTTRQQVYDMWKTVFGDSDEYMEIYFREKYRNENTLIYFESGKAVSSLQMLPFDFSFHGSEIPVAYFSGLCTLPEARQKGFMGSLIKKSFGEMDEKGIPLAILVPQDETIMKFYRQFGFTQTFNAGIPLPNLQKIMVESENLPNAYEIFDSFFRQRDMTVQKTPDDFRAIVEEAALFDFPVKKSLMGMSRITDVEKLLIIFAKKYPQIKVSVKVSDPIIGKNNAVFAIKNGSVSKSSKKGTTHFYVEIDALTQLLLGYKTSEFSNDYRLVFPEKQPLIGFMME
ncbi:MAG: GNAT family N-acetyltransferase [Petrimonas sp.]|nr:GNAT family N-acetyltransferase [Petrimonas sp.]